MVHRYDSGELASPTQLENGYLKCDSRITRTGVFTYALGDGTIRRELRTPDEVFHADALQSFGLSPLTNDHPAQALTSKNTRKFQVGTVADVRRDGEFVRATLMLTDDDAIGAAQSGKQQLSCGYTCDVEVQAGVTAGIDGVPDGIRFDALQRNIRGNHVALVARGRAGPSASLRLDSGDAIMTEDEIQPQPAGLPEGAKMSQIRLGGVDFDVPAQTAQALQVHLDSRTKENDKSKGALEALQAELAAATARADAADAKVSELEKAHADAVGPDAVKALVKARVELETKAAKILGADVKVDELDDAEIHRAVILAVTPGAEAKLDEASEDYIRARFDHAVESFKEPEPPAAPSQTITLLRGAPSERADAQTARERMIAHNRELGLKPLHSASA